MWKGEKIDSTVKIGNNLWDSLRRTAHGFTNPHNYAARALLLT